MTLDHITADPSLEAVLAQIAADNSLTSLTVGRMPVGSRILWTCTVHWSGHAVSGHPCESGHSEKSIRHAVEAALEAAAKDRTPPVVVPSAMSALDLAEAA